MSAQSQAYGGVVPDGLQASISDNWIPPPNHLPFTTATGFPSSPPQFTPGLPPSLAPVSALPLGFLQQDPRSRPELFSGAGFGFTSASASALLVPTETAAAPANSVGDINFTLTSTSTSTSTPAPAPTPTPTSTPHPVSSLAGLARHHDQAFAAVHCAFTSPHYFNPTSFGATLPNVHHPLQRLPSANGFTDHFATADHLPSPDFLQPPFFSPLQRRICELHVCPELFRPAGPSPIPYSPPAPTQFGYYLQAPNNFEVEGFDLRGNLNNILHHDEHPPADDLQGPGEHKVDVQDEHGRIALDSLLDDNMPAVTTSRKRTRAAASLEEPAASASVKTPRSQSGSASVSSRRPAKPPRTVPTVVIPDSDDIFAIEDDDAKQEMFDMTENDNLPVEHKVVKEDLSTKLCKFECIICLDTASTLTVTHCGHMFCGPCLHQAMHAEVTKKICPMCRQKLDTRPKNSQPAKTSKTFFHLELKLKLSKRQGKQPIRPPRRV